MRLIQLLVGGDLFIGCHWQRFAVDAAGLCRVELGEFRVAFQPAHGNAFWAVCQGFLAALCYLHLALGWNA